MKIVILTRHAPDIDFGTFPDDHVSYTCKIDTAMELLKGSAESVVVCVEYGDILTDETIIDMQTAGARVYNIHRGDPARYRGASVLNHQILDGEKTAFVTLMEIQPHEAVDTGRVVKKYLVNIKGLTYPEAVAACRHYYNNLICHAVGERRGAAYHLMARGKLYRRRKPKDSSINMGISEKGKRKILAADPVDYPAYFDLDGYRFYLQISSKELIKDPNSF